MTHSLVDCVALAIETPVGVIVHTGDFKIDLSPPDGKAFDLHTFAEYGKRGVLALLQDSTNVDRPGYTPSEWAVKPRLDEVFSRTKKKLFFSCFSSSIYRIRIALDLAHTHRRKVAVVGRSMVESSEIAQDLGYLDIPPGLMINPGQINDYAPENVLILISGTQGEPMSALIRAAVDNHKHAHIVSGDTVVLSSRVIPGNEKSIYRVIDHLYRRDANVIFDDGASGLIHVSGHASQEEQRLLINLLRPKYFIPGARRLPAFEEACASGDGDRRHRSGDYDRRRRRAGADRERRPQEWEGHGGPSVYRFGIERAMWLRTSSSATGGTSAKTVLCCRSSPSTSSAARSRASPRWSRADSPQRTTI